MAAEQVEATLTCARPQTRFTAKLQSNQPEQPTEGSLKYNNRGFTEVPETGQEGGDTERAAPTPTPPPTHPGTAAEKLEPYRSCKTPSSRSLASQLHTGIPNPEQQRWGEEPAQHWCGKSLGIQSAWETQTPLSQGRALPQLQHHPGECPAGSHTAGEASLHTGPVGVSAGCTQQ